MSVSEGEDKDSISDDGGENEKTLECLRCGRGGHSADSCYAKNHANVKCGASVVVVKVMFTKRATQRPTQHWVRYHGRNG
ncbi:hypothetical protein GN244_ATG05314 [Phytophthora infestans]|uniref:CCHC-type domain-containing protein n=1 Tax=Phytophthora infestans TaxID=4787 RepID=A0A833TG07_PHYIN|nr:hypothetical protein GN244_ATG05314 [Phytophthora infestans]